MGLTQMAQAVTPHRRRSAVAPSVAEAMEAGFLPALDEDPSQADDMFTPSETHSCSCTDTLRTIGY